MLFVLDNWPYNFISRIGGMDGQRVRSQDVGMHLEQNSQSKLHHLLLLLRSFPTNFCYIILTHEDIPQVHACMQQKKISLVFTDFPTGSVS